MCSQNDPILFELASIMLLLHLEKKESVMKQALKYSFLLATVLIVSACDKGGGGSNDSAPKQAVVPTVPGPQGQVFANQQNDPNTYCNYNNVTGTVICSARNQFGNGTCNTSSQTYTDINTLCQRLQVLQNESVTCNARQAIQITYDQNNCQSILSQLNGGGFNQNIPNQQVDSNFKTVQCKFEASRIANGKFLGIRTSKEIATPSLTTLISFDSRRTQTFDLRSRFLGFDIGNFGRTTMIYAPSGVRNVSDTLTLSNSGLNKALNLSQSGFAGENVSMDVMSDDGNMKLTVSCKGQSQFRKNVAGKIPTQFVCSGTSRLDGGYKNEINISLPYNSNLTNSPIELADGLSAVITGDSNNGDNAQITFTAQGVSTNTSLVSSAYVKTATELHATDGLTEVNLKCGPQ